MRCVGIEKGENVILTVEEKFLWMRKLTKYQSDGKIVGDYYHWLKLPDKTIVPDIMSFQLDAWLRSA